MVMSLNTRVSMTTVEPQRFRKSSTERVRRWRARHAELNRERQREYQRRYRSTAKGVLTEVRYEAARRGNR